MPRERPAPPPFEPEALEHSLDRYLMWGLVFMVVLIAGFIVYRVREPTLRADAAAAQRTSYRDIGTQLFATNCSSCHGKGAIGGSAPVLNAKEFLKSTSDDQIRALVAGGVPGTEMPAWSLAFGGTLTDEQIVEITTYLRSLQPSAPSVPNWRSGHA
jgi:mono/diheme cytochrome c family protein